MKRLVILALLVPTLATAQGVPSDMAQLYPTMPGVEYYCTDAEGRRFELGQVICITASCTTWMAKCDMSLNNPTWRKTQDGCPGAGLRDRFQRLQPAVEARGVYPKV